MCLECRDCYVHAADTGDGRGDLIARDDGADAFGRAGQDHVASAQRHEAGEPCDQRRDVEDQHVDRRVLHDLTREAMEGFITGAKAINVGTKGHLTFEALQSAISQTRKGAQ